MLTSIDKYSNYIDLHISIFIVHPCNVNQINHALMVMAMTLAHVSLAASRSPAPLPGVPFPFHAMPKKTFMLVPG